MVESGKTATKISTVEGRRSRERKDSVSRRKLGDILVETGLLPPDKLLEALERQKGTNKRLGRVLLDMKIISEEEIAFALAMQLKIPFVDLSSHQSPAEVIESVPEEVSRKFVCIPIGLKNNILDVAMSDPLDLNLIKDLQFITGYSVQPAISTTSQIMETLQKHYHPEKTIGEVANEFGGEELMEFFPEKEIRDEEEGTFEAAQDSPFVKMVDLVIKNAIKKGASDVHIEAQENQVRVRNRIDGVLQDAIKLPKWTQPIIISRIKVLGGMDISERRLPQDGRIKVRSKNFSVDLRVSTLPTYYGEKAVIRILNKEEAFLSLEELGFGRKNLDIIKSFIRQPQGMILITGPTGSGKTSTLYACMRQIRSEEVNIVTVEDPVEYQLAGINQNQVKDSIGLSFAKFLKHALRQDPDIIMVGEIRDRETAEIAIQASLTGHLVLSTLHTNDSPSSITRLLEMGVEPYLISSSLMACMAQRLVRTICPECKMDYYAPKEVLAELGIDNGKNIRLAKGKGCSACYDSGFKGRMGLSELLEMDVPLQSLILKNPSIDTLQKHLKKMGHRTLKDLGYERVLEGMTTVEEVKRVSSLEL